MQKKPQQYRRRRDRPEDHRFRDGYLAERWKGQVKLTLLAVALLLLLRGMEWVTGWKILPGEVVQESHPEQRQRRYPE